MNVQRLYEFEGGPVGYWARGHHDPAAFLDGVAWYQCDDGRRVPSDEPVCRAAYVRHEYWRAVPTSDPYSDGWTSYTMTARGPGRGAFPVTVVEH